MSYNTGQLFNFIQGSDITGQSSYDIWKSLNPNGTEGEFLEYIQSGPRGEKGDSAAFYAIAVSDTVIKRSINDSLKPETITFSGYYRLGTDPTRQEYAGRFIIQETVDGLVWETKYTSEADEASVVYTPSSSDVTFVKGTLYAAGGTSNELDTQTIAVLIEALEAMTTILSNTSHIIATDSNGNIDNYDGCNTSIQVFNGIKDVTSESTYEVNASTGVTGSWDLASYTYTVTGLSSDDGYVDITATYNGTSITKRFSISKSKPGKSAYEIWSEIEGNEGKSLEEYLAQTQNVQSDWDQTDDTALDFIKNKPTSFPASDVHDWAKAETRPEYTAEDVGADSKGSAEAALTNANAYTDEKIGAEVTARETGDSNTLDSAKEYVDGKINDITLGNLGYDENHTHEIGKITGLQDALDSKVPNTRTINDKALTENITLSASDVGADASGTASTAVSTHNVATDAHNDIRLLVTELDNRLNALANSTDEDLDQMAEIVDYIKSNRSVIESVTITKVNVADIIDNLTTNVADKPLSAAQGVAIKALIDELQATVNDHTHDYNDLPDIDYATVLGFDTTEIVQ